MTLKIVEGDARRLDEVIDVMKSAFGDEYGEAWTRSQCAGILPMTGVTLLVADGDRSIAGFALYRTIADDAELLLLAVAPEAQRSGVGSSLLDRFVGAARREGASRIHLEVRDGNPAAGMYEAAGFEVAGRRRNYYRGAGGRQFDALTYVLTR